MGETRIPLPLRAQVTGSRLCDGCGEETGEGWLILQNGKWLCLIAAVSTTDSGYKGEENMTLQEFFQENPRGALAFSGGVDSAYLLYAAASWWQDWRAYYVKSPFQPDFEWQDALRLAEEQGVPMTTLPVDVLEEPLVAENSPERCYYLQKRPFSEGSWKRPGKMAILF